MVGGLMSDDNRIENFAKGAAIGIPLSLLSRYGRTRGLSLSAPAFDATGKVLKGLSKPIEKSYRLGPGLIND